MASLIPARARWRFLAKTAAAFGLAALADLLLFDVRAGSVLGLFAFAWAIVATASQPALQRDKRAWGLLALTALMAAALAYDPNWLAWLLFWSSLSMAVLVPRYAAFGDAWQWLRRLLLHGVTGPFVPLMDCLRIQRLKGRGGRLDIARYAAALVLPLVGGAVFLLLFAQANPLISDALNQVELPTLDGDTVFRVLFWVAATVCVWASLRPRRSRLRPAPLQESGYSHLPGIGLASVTLSLVLFNALFAVQNGLDLAVMFAGISLPNGLNYAEYAHQGAYPLIATAMLAGGFVLLTTRPGSPMAQSKWVRGLVIGWTAQNLVLVGFSIIRTLNYISAYSLTEMRIAALLWMGLIGLGLILITLRMLTGRTSVWLINGNAAAAVLLLTGCSFADLGEISARYNIRHARELGGKGVELDLCYINRLGGSGLVPLAELQMRGDLQPGLKQRVDNVRQQILIDLLAEQADWRSWEWRNAIRLQRLPGNLRKASLIDFRDFGCGGASLKAMTAASTATPIDAED